MRNIPCDPGVKEHEHSFALTHRSAEDERRSVIQHPAERRAGLTYHLLFASIFGEYSIGNLQKASVLYCTYVWSATYDPETDAPKEFVERIRADKEHLISEVTALQIPDVQISA